MAKYNTKQKQAILSFLKTKAGEHITAAEIMNHFHEHESSIGTATVYRQLDQLVQAGFVKKYTLDASCGSCFEYIGDEIACDSTCFHFKCDSCGKLLHFHCHSMMDMNHHMLQHHGFEIDSIRTVFYGACNDCAKKEKTLEHTTQT